jgi:hypothetical protein
MTSESDFRLPLGMDDRRGDEEKGGKGERSEK